MAEPSPSSIPPRLARHASITALIGALATLIGAVATQIVLAPKPREEPPPAPTATDKPIPVPPKEPPTTDEGVVEARIVRDHANQALIEHRDQLGVDESELCLLKADLRELWARMVQLEGGKRGAAARTDFEDRTAAWAVCTPGKRIELRTLREAADSALRRR